MLSLYPICLQALSQNIVESFCENDDFIFSYVESAFKCKLCKTLTLKLLSKLSAALPNLEILLIQQTLYRLRFL
ncbi:hypothetical protein HMPREF3213_02863 [Heyndrickxia coagulans]|uniref:Uncharacterized protein n=1 Tax=Heyndrickxia coagulans TaxID=1398 RepID=A0A133KH51_HEYCO|nr:hypothetical protein HMPREF3213_02863 [Heyndrickxia coagulans]